MKFTLRNYFAVGSVLIVVGSFATVANANHSWGGYHWARTANPFTIMLGDNLTTNWDSYLQTASSDWSLSNVLNTAIVTGGTNPKFCRAKAGRAEICNARYGNNGWLGIASIWISGYHITQGTVKMNDTYFNTATYNTAAWKNLVMCQEVGHLFGLDHQDENFSNTPLGTCMDYSNNPVPNQHPNQHDYDMLETLYAHLDTTTTISQTSLSSPADIDTSDPKQWGKEIKKSFDGRASLFEKDFGNGRKMFTHVFWADQERDKKAR